MSDAYERERQNNSRLDELASKVSALRGVTIDIYDNARDQRVLDNTNETFSTFATSLKGSAGRLTRMAQSGNKVAILKLAGMIVGVVVVLYWIWGLVFGHGSKCARTRSGKNKADGAAPPPPGAGLSAGKN